MSNQKSWVKQADIRDELRRIDEQIAALWLQRKRLMNELAELQKGNEVYHMNLDGTTVSVIGDKTIEPNSIEFRQNGVTMLTVRNVGLPKDDET